MMRRIRGWAVLVPAVVAVAGAFSATSLASRDVKLYGCSAVARQHPVEVVFFGTKLAAESFCPHWHPPLAAWRRYSTVYFAKALSKDVCTFSGTNGLLLDIYSKPSYAPTVKRTFCKASTWARLGFYPFH
jgi:hypothetical protein